MKRLNDQLRIIADFFKEQIKIIMNFKNKYFFQWLYLSIWAF